MKEFEAEIAISTRLTPHPSTVKIIGIVRKPRAIVMELYPLLSLQDAFHNPDSHASQLTFEKLVTMAIQCSAGIINLHEHRVVHRDIACRNFLLKEDYSCSASDFGLSMVLPAGKVSANVPEKTRRVERIPLNTSAPEQVLEGVYGFKSDVYMCPFTDCPVFLQCVENGFEMSPFFDKLLLGHRPPMPGDWPVQLTSLISECWHTDPGQRPDMEEVNTALRELRVEVASKHLPLPSFTSNSDKNYFGSSSVKAETAVYGVYKSLFPSLQPAGKAQGHSLTSESDVYAKNTYASLPAKGAEGGRAADSSSRKVKGKGTKTKATAGKLAGEDNTFAALGPPRADEDVLDVDAEIEMNMRKDKAKLKLEKREQKMLDALQQAQDTILQVDQQLGSASAPNDRRVSTNSSVAWTIDVPGLGKTGPRPKGKKKKK
eukprot:CAMPEP_0175174668 /NCGR_PEP_ID=MMETSP0087-20121206/32767_1 /TAXON_ID=136419 /ORGANISM="Unknown Unknown, Strain D1" /LENGTH=429 /DNA_ID=CAMNT_0016466177 /DNA_START=77 /DNA_END=1366 /DNA_ORIENTATION=-